MPSSDRVKGRLHLSMTRHFIHNNALQRPGQGQITSINDATRANFKVRGAHPGFLDKTFLGLVFWAAGRKGTDYANQRERKRETDRQTDRQTETETDRQTEREREREREKQRERERERGVMCKLTATFSLKVQQNGKASGLERKGFF